MSSLYSTSSQRYC